MIGGIVMGPTEISYSVSAAKYIAAGLCMGIGGIGAALAQGFIGGKACESIGQRPESAKAVREMLIMACVFAETSSIFSLVVAFTLLLV
ncbi:ATP synthase F0 subunit C [Candidatus Dependentiae bacterium]